MCGSFTLGGLVLLPAWWQLQDGVGESLIMIVGALTPLIAMISLCSPDCMCVTKSAKILNIYTYIGMKQNKGKADSEKNISGIQ